MNETELAQILRSMHGNAPHGEQTTAIHLFGIRYAAELNAPHVSIERLVVLSEVGPTYGTEVRKGMRLAKYVNLNASAAAHGL